MLFYPEIGTASLQPPFQAAKVRINERKTKFTLIFLSERKYLNDLVIKVLFFIDINWHKRACTRKVANNNENNEPAASITPDYPAFFSFSGLSSHFEHSGNPGSSQTPGLFLTYNFTHTTLNLNILFHPFFILLARRIVYSRERNTLSSRKE